MQKIIGVLMSGSNSNGNKKPLISLHKVFNPKDVEYDKNFPAIKANYMKDITGANVEVIDGPLDKGRLHDIPVRSIVRIIVDGYNHTVYWDGRRIHDSWHGKDVVKKYYNSLEGEIEFCDTTPKQSETQGFCSIFAMAAYFLDKEDRFREIEDKYSAIYKSKELGLERKKKIAEEKVSLYTEEFEKLYAANKDIDITPATVTQYYRC